MRLILRKKKSVKKATEKKRWKYIFKMKMLMVRFLMAVKKLLYTLC